MNIIKVLWNEIDPKDEFDHVMRTLIRFFICVAIFASFMMAVTLASGVLSLIRNDNPLHHPSCDCLKTPERP